MRYTTPQQESINEFQTALEKHCREMDILDAGVFLTDWFIIGTAQNIEKPDENIYWRVYSGGSQPIHITAGLIKYASIRSEQDIWNPDTDGGDE